MMSNGSNMFKLFNNNWVRRAHLVSDRKKNGRGAPDTIAHVHAKQTQNANVRQQYAKHVKRKCDLLRDRWALPDRGVPGCVGNNAQRNIAAGRTGTKVPRLLLTNHWGVPVPQSAYPPGFWLVCRTSQFCANLSVTKKLLQSKKFQKKSFCSKKNNFEQHRQQKVPPKGAHFPIISEFDASFYLLYFLALP